MMMMIVLSYGCSFGMLLWELSFNREPYANTKYHEIVDHVMSGKRETLNFGEGPRDIIDGFTEIIKSAWQQDSRKRPTGPKISKLLESLYRSHHNDENVSMNHLENPQITENVVDTEENPSGN